jgi:hypothetical protein
LCDLVIDPFKYFIAMAFGDDLSEDLIKITNPNLISKSLPFKTTIAIPVIISYIINLQRLKFRL